MRKSRFLKGLTVLTVLITSVFFTTNVSTVCAAQISPSGAKFEYILGDVDNDSEVTSFDALEVLRYSVGLENFTYGQYTIADVDFDESITSVDALEILRYSVGLTSNDKIGASIVVNEYVTYTFRNDKLLEEHFNKHNDKLGYPDTDAYTAGANRVINDERSLHKYEAEDGDDVYYLVETNELVIVSTDGFIRTYFKPDGDGLAYFNRQ